MIADGSDVVLGLPEALSLDARTSVKPVDDPPAEEVLGNRARRDEQRPDSGVAGLAGCDASEQEPEARAGGTKLARGRHREVELERVAEEEDAVDSRVALEVDEPYGAHFSFERVRPVSEHRGDRRGLSDTERQVQVGEAVALVHRKGADGGARDDPAVFLAQAQHAITQAVSLLYGEHRSFPLSVRRRSSSRDDHTCECLLDEAARQTFAVYVRSRKLAEQPAARATRPRRRCSLGLGRCGLTRREAGDNAVGARRNFMMAAERGQTAVVVPVPTADPFIAACRDRVGLPGAPAMPAHITIVYPFLDVSHLTDSVLGELHAFFSARDRLHIRCERTDRFPNVLYLAPEPADGLREMTDALVERWPEAPPYGGAYEDVIPHLTVLEGHDTLLNAVEAELGRHLPFLATLARGYLYAFDGHVWRTRAELPFRAPNPPQHSRANISIEPFVPSDEPDLFAAYAEVVAAGGAFPRRPPADRATFHTTWIEASTVVSVARASQDIVGGYFIKPNFPGLAAHIANAGYLVAHEFRGPSDERLPSIPSKRPINTDSTR